MAWLIEVFMAIVLIASGMATYSEVAIHVNRQGNVAHLAAQTAAFWTNISSAANAYIQANGSSLGSGGVLSCSNPQFFALLGNSTSGCTDPLGQTLAVYVPSSSQGGPNSYVVLATAPPSPAVIQHYGLGTHSASSPGSPTPWESFAMQAAREITVRGTSSNTGLVLQTAVNNQGYPMPHPGALMVPDSQQGYATTLAGYFPQEGADPQAVPPVYGYDGYALVMSAQAGTALPGPCDLTLSVAPEGIVYGQSTTVSWSQPDATSCDLKYTMNGTTGDFPGLSASGTRTYTPAQAGVLTVTASCSGSAGVCRQSATVAVNFTVTLEPESSRLDCPPSTISVPNGDPWIFADTSGAAGVQCVWTIDAGCVGFPLQEIATTSTSGLNLLDMRPYESVVNACNGSEPAMIETVACTSADGLLSTVGIEHISLLPMPFTTPTVYCPEYQSPGIR